MKPNFGLLNSLRYYYITIAMYVCNFKAHRLASFYIYNKNSSEKVDEVKKKQTKTITNFLRYRHYFHMKQLDHQEF